MHWIAPLEKDTAVLANVGRVTAYAPSPRPAACSLRARPRPHRVAEVERRLSVVEELETVVSANVQRATRLCQSILQKAFTGELTA